MQTVILAAGLGKRLRPLTNNLPKPMVLLGGKPILEYTLSILPEEVDEVIIVVGYLSEKIKKYFGSSFGRLKIIYAEQPEPKGTADGLLKAKPFLHGGYFLLIHADDLFHRDDLKKCVLSDEPAILVKEIAHPERFGVCLVDKNNQLLDILEKVENPPTNLANIGVYLLNQKIFNVPPGKTPNGELNLAMQIGKWAKQTTIKVIKAKFWHPIGYPEDLKPAEHFIALPERLRIN
jgi:NDP-sugar pyrophosphorylase family protein